MVGGVMGDRTSVMPGLETMRRKRDETEREDAELPIVGTKLSGGTVAGSKAMEAKHQEHLLHHGVISQGRLHRVIRQKLSTKSSCFPECNFPFASPIQSSLAFPYLSHPPYESAVRP